MTLRYRCAMLYPLSYQATWLHHYHRVYHELTIDHLSMWLGSLVDRALHRYRKVMGSNPVQAWIFFRLLFQPLKLIAHFEDQISLKIRNILLSFCSFICLEHVNNFDDNEKFSGPIHGNVKCPINKKVFHQDFQTP